MGDHDHDRVTSVTTADIDGLTQQMLQQSLGIDMRVMQAADPSFGDSVRQTLISSIGANPRYA
jgi:hypothetical protein